MFSGVGGIESESLKLNRRAMPLPRYHSGIAASLGLLELGMGACVCQGPDLKKKGCESVR